MEEIESFLNSPGEVTVARRGDSIILIRKKEHRVLPPLIFENVFLTTLMMVSPHLPLSDNVREPLIIITTTLALLYIIITVMTLLEMMSFKDNPRPKQSARRLSFLQQRDHEDKIVIVKGAPKNSWVYKGESTIKGVSDDAVIVMNDSLDKDCLSHGITVRTLQGLRDVWDSSHDGILTEEHSRAIEDILEAYHDGVRSLYEQEYPWSFGLEPGDISARVVTTISESVKPSWRAGELREVGKRVGDQVNKETMNEEDASKLVSELMQDDQRAGSERKVECENGIGMRDADALVSEMMDDEVDNDSRYEHGDDRYEHTMCLMRVVREDQPRKVNFLDIEDVIGNRSLSSDDSHDDSHDDSLAEKYGVHEELDIDSDLDEYVVDSDIKE